MPVILAFDTAMSGCGVALLDAVGKTHVRMEAMPRGQSERLMPMIDGLMKECGTEYAALDSIVTTIGPGAFTGLRIGISAARALALSLSIPVHGVTTLDVLARQYAGEAKADFWVVLETKRSDFYAQGFSVDGKAKGEPLALEGAALRALMKDGEYLIGDGAARFAGAVDAAALTVVPGYDLPDPAVMAAMAAEGINLHPAEPLYLRGADVSQSKQVQRAVDDLSRL